ncbi:MAG: hypothetical protein H0T82_03410, partial [Sphingomonas sp.]|nr:hypothetical protein [Sphingomonas sp.]
MTYKEFNASGSMLAMTACLLAPAAAVQAQAPRGQQPAGSAQASGVKKPSEALPRDGEVVVTGTRSDVIATPDRVSF